MLRLLRLGPKLHEDRTDVIETLRRQLRCANARQLLRNDDLLVERGAHSAIALRPMRRDPTFARECLIPGHQFGGRRPRRAPPQRKRKIGFQPTSYFPSPIGFDPRVTTGHHCAPPHTPTHPSIFLPSPS